MSKAIRNGIRIFIPALLITVLACSLSNDAKVDRLFADYSGKNVPGAAIMVIHDGQTIFEKGYGEANLEKQIPVETQTNFRLASFTKQFTAMCIMMLKERGKLDYDQTLTDIFPDFPMYGKKITIRHLLHHVSGLVAYEDLIPDSATVQVLDKDVLRMMMGQDSTYFPPGTEYRYSNSGYAMLAMIIEKVSGKRFADFLKENIFDPLGMQNTVAYENGISTVNHRAFGYTKEADHFEFTDQSITSAVLGDGGIYTSVDDLFKWDQALYTEKLVKKSTLQEAFTSGILTNGKKIDYGYGWMIDDYRDHHRLYHTGSSRGFATIIQRYPEDKFTVMILSNRSEPPLTQIADKLTDLFLIDAN
jgi:CubicO group peptidase (beta-lactamase class C family)